MFVHPQHHVHVEVNASDVEIGGADVGDVIGHDQLGVQPLLAIFVDLHAPAQQAAVAVPGGVDGDVVVRSGGGDDGGRAAFPNASQTPPETGVGGERGHGNTQDRKSTRLNYSK